MSLWDTFGFKNKILLDPSQKIINEVFNVPTTTFSPASQTISNDSNRAAPSSNLFIPAGENASPVPLTPELQSALKKVSGKTGELTIQVIAGVSAGLILFYLLKKKRKR